MSFTLHLPGPPHGKDRPRVRVVQPKGKRAFANIYTPKETEAVEKAWHGAWVASGSPTVEGPFAIAMEVYVARPAGHFLTDGVSLSAEGRRHPHPENQKPDMDNVLKLVLDALNGHAYRDDVACVRFRNSARLWAIEEGVRVWLSEVEDDT